MNVQILLKRVPNGPIVYKSALMHAVVTKRVSDPMITQPIDVI